MLLKEEGCAQAEERKGIVRLRSRTRQRGKGGRVTQDRKQNVCARGKAWKCWKDDGPERKALPVGEGGVFEKK